MHEVNKWVRTDPDNKQYGRLCEDGKYEFKERGEHLVIDLSKISTVAMEKAVSSYYGSLEKLEETCGGKTGSYFWLIAECIFEQESGLY